jgi:hypothetical protein
MAYIGASPAPLATAVDANAVETGDIQNSAVTTAKIADAAVTAAKLAPGAVVSFDSGTVMLFGQTSAPTGWTKDTTNYNNSGIRVVTGSAGTGGTIDFTTAFASQTPSGSINTTGLSAGSYTLTTSDIPSHSHTLPWYTVGSGGPPYIGTAAGSLTGNQTSSSNTGGGGSHSHSISGSATFTGTAINLAVKYVDVIRATKD